ncbi:hypothetical protein FAZ19_05750 [Sphingobacterium alkalisoli]|uniref:Uncharacterized protein n=1 Tax=Sphingobacterium alkalisoli TaxID=1874115 RepID=A0A4U0H4D3_9SPHI|nr:hypothetical protein [Sphingobacterium alkalisoli]TJY66426.1 hypothetical protein FAZ19_05750 [Sphingobacterium alkalisoli]GGH16484.1 hypothetical protein GCM10011418_18890 [Sphingobacterium alkalisoli]
MISFIPDTLAVLPYDRTYYIDFLNDDNISSHWQGISFQLYRDRDCSFTEFLNTYRSLFEDVVIRFGREDRWIVNHDDKDMPWFPTNAKTLVNLRLLFKQNNISNNFKGYLTFTGEDLIVYSEDIISYPYKVFDEDGILYKNLDISHNELPLIIKISGHLNIDFISTDKLILRSLVNEYSQKFVIKEYWGSEIWN